MIGSGFSLSIPHMRSPPSAKVQLPFTEQVVVNTFPHRYGASRAGSSDSMCDIFVITVDRPRDGATVAVAYVNGRPDVCELSDKDYLCVGCSDRDPIPGVATPTFTGKPMHIPSFARRSSFSAAMQISGNCRSLAGKRMRRATLFRLESR